VKNKIENGENHFLLGIIWKYSYKNKDWEEKKENIVIKQTNWSIYIEFDKSYTFDDIDTEILPDWSNINEKLKELAQNFYLAEKKEIQKNEIRSKTENFIQDFRSETTYPTNDLLNTFKN